MQRKGKGGKGRGWGRGGRGREGGGLNNYSSVGRLEWSYATAIVSQYNDNKVSSWLDIITSRWLLCLSATVILVIRKQFYVWLLLWTPYLPPMISVSNKQLETIVYDTVGIKLIVYNSIRRVRYVALHLIHWKKIYCFFLSPVAVEACRLQPVMSVGLRTLCAVTL